MMNTWIKRKSFFYGLIFAVVLSSPACLKTRTNVKPDNADTASSDEANAAESKTAGKPKPSPVTRGEIDDIKNEVTRITGKVDELEHNQRDSNAADVRESITKIDARVQELEKNQILVMSELKELKDRGAAPAVPAKPASKKDQAEEHFSAGEKEFSEGNFKKAIVEFSKVQELNPKSAHMPVVLRKIALSFEKLGMKKEAQGFFAELVEKYPKSPEAKKSRSKLKED